MYEICAILPLKTFEHAKARLSGVLRPEERSKLARFMALDTLRALSAVPEIERTVVAGQCAEHAALASAFGYEFVEDDPALDVSANLQRAVQIAVTPRTTTVLYVAADLPLLRAEDLRDLLARHREGLTICRASRDNGTNAIVATPPGLIRFSFGSDSANRHAEAARSAGAQVRILDIEPFRHDLDEPVDLRAVVLSDSRSEAAEYVRASKLPTRAAPPPKAGAPVPA